MRARAFAHIRGGGSSVDLVFREGYKREKSHFMLSFSQEKNCSIAIFPRGKDG